MGAGHGHGSSGAHRAPPTRRGPRAALLGFLMVAGVATIAGLVALWPTDPPKPPQRVDPGSLVAARVVSVSPPCPIQPIDAVPATDQATPESGATDDSAAGPPRCNLLTVDVQGSRQEVQVPPYVSGSSLGAGDEVRVLRLTAAEAAQGGPAYAFVGVERQRPLLLLAIAFVVVVLAVAWHRGLLALVGLGVAAVVLTSFMLPALLSGANGPLVTLVGSSAIMFVVLYLAHGPSLRTSTALAGTLVGVAITTGVGLWIVDAGHFSGVSEQGEYLMSWAPELDFRGLLTAAIIVAGLGVLNDVTITQSSAVWELRAAAPGLSRRRLFTSGMRIGRDHIASTIYTIVFAYAGTALIILLLLSLFHEDLATTLTDDDLTEEIARTLSTAIGLVLAVPVTTAIAALTVGEGGREPAHAAH